MSVRGIGDAYAFQRLLWLLVGTVIVPTVLLSLYGVMAIRNQRSALIERVRSEQMDTLQRAAEQVFAELDRLDAIAHDAVRDCPLPCAPTVDGTTMLVVWDASAGMPASLAAAGIDGERIDTATVWYPSDENGLNIFSLDWQGCIFP